MVVCAMIGSGRLLQARGQPSLLRNMVVLMERTMLLVPGEDHVGPPPPAWGSMKACCGSIVCQPPGRRCAWSVDMGGGQA